MKGSRRKRKLKDGSIAYRVRIDLPSEPGERNQTSRQFSEHDHEDPEEAAKRWQRRMNHMIDHGKYVGDSAFQESFLQASDTPLDDYLDTWISVHEQNIRESTFQRYKQILEQHIKPELGGIRLSELLPMNVQTFYQEKLESGRLRGSGGLAPSTVRQMHAILHKAFEDAKKWQKIKDNPCDYVTSPSPSNREMMYLTPDQARLYLETAQDTPYYPLYKLALSTGMRRGEILGIRYQDVDVKSSTLHVRQAIVQTVKNDLIVSEPKSDRAYRSINLSDDILRTLSNDRKLEKSTKNLVFSTEGSTNDPVNPDTILRHHRSILEEADLPEIRFHDLRHTAATLLLHDPETTTRMVADILGHSTPTITSSIYSHVLPDKKSEALSNLSDQLNGG